LVSVVGEFDVSVREEAIQVLTAAAEATKGGHIVVDLSGGGFLDSSGIAALLAGMYAARGVGASYRVSGVDGMARHVLTLTGLLALLAGEVHPAAA